MALTEINSKSIKDGDITEDDIAISNAPSDGKFLQYKDSSDKLTWADVDTTTIPVADEDTDTTSFPVFTTAATGDQAPKTNEDKLTFNASSGTLSATNLDTVGIGGKIGSYATASGGGKTDAAFLDGNGVTISWGASAPCELRFQTSSVAQFVGFKPPSTGNVIWQLPSADGSADQVLKTNGSATLSWTDAGSGATGGGTEKIFWENGTTIDQDYTVGTSFGAACNAMSAGPITINTGKTVTVDAGDTWTIV